MEGTLQSWKLYRQFQKTLESIQTEIKEEKETDFDTVIGNTIAHDDFCGDNWEITSVEGEGEQLGGRHNPLLQFNKHLELKTYFNLWKDVAELASKQRRKAEFYHRFTTLERVFKRWKIFKKEEKEKRERKKWIKAVIVDENRLMR